MKPTHASGAADLPEALRIAAALEYCDANVAREAINELRRLHALTAQAPSQLGGFSSGDMASAAAQGFRDGLAAAQAISAEPAATQPAPQADSVLEDAARWQMAVLVGNEVMLHPDKRSNPSAVKAYMDAVHSGLDLTGAVDAARKQGANHD